jgi:hypothetical protein
MQLRQTWEEDEEPQRFLIFDRDSKFSVDVISTESSEYTARESAWESRSSPT